ncbi:MAG: ATP-binding protein [Armatimonadetes bacterium]|nr:ATP-binding protein [Armatimonadota bacterium]MCX7967456.1 ATP-binding protein [Armatimonadota bacterium]MDW8143736.1 ATP-binding protein [Armatimonadota bacterium]
MVTTTNAELRKGVYVDDSLPTLPPAPESVEETGLTLDFLSDLTLKTLYVRGTLLGSELAEYLKLPHYSVLEHVLKFLREEELVEVRRGYGQFSTQWIYGLTNKGFIRARELMEQSAYVGPAPVPIRVYTDYIDRYQVPWEGITEQTLREVLSDLVVNDRLIRKLGPAFNSGKSMFLYGNAGNGKTSIAERFARALKGGVLVPYSLEVNGQIIRFFDPAYHEPISVPEEKFQASDRRWVLCKRPFIVVGGELQMDHLELSYDPTVKYYNAPFQLKANGGVFMIDDFGRQRIHPKDLLNRWIVPLEKGIDYYTLQTGEQIVVPFKVLIIFSTNIAPRELVEEAFLRRIRYKIEVGDPSEGEFREIFRRVAETMGFEYEPELLDYLIERHYKRVGRGFRAVHPRDLLMQVRDYCNYMGWHYKLTRELIDLAVETYFVEL